jgi:serine acetyltransferase
VRWMTCGAVSARPELLELFSAQYRRDPSLVKAAQADMQAVMDRDPACDKYLQILLFFKGFQARTYSCPLIGSKLHVCCGIRWVASVCQ